MVQVVVIFSKKLSPGHLEKIRQNLTELQTSNLKFVRPWEL